MIRVGKEERAGVELATYRAATDCSTTSLAPALPRREQWKQSQKHSKLKMKEIKLSGFHVVYVVRTEQWIPSRERSRDHGHTCSYMSETRASAACCLGFRCSPVFALRICLRANIFGTCALRSCFKAHSFGTSRTHGGIV